MLIFVRERYAEGAVLARIDRDREGGAVRRHVIGPAGAHHEPLSVVVVRVPRPLDDDEYRGHREAGEGDVLAGVARDDHDLELLRGGGVPHDPIVAVGGRARVDGRPSHGVREHADEVVDVLELGRESCPNDVIAAGHALDDLPGDVGMGLVRGHVEALAGRDQEVIQEEGGHGAGIPRELLRQSQYCARALPLPRRLLVGVDEIAALLLLQPLEQYLQLPRRRLCRAAHEALEETPKRRFLVLLLLAAEEYLELGLVGDARRELRMLLDQNRDLLEPAEPAHGLKRSEGHGELWLVVVVGVLLRVVPVQVAREELAGMGLDAEGLPGAKDLEHEGELAAHGLLEGGAVPDHGGPRGMRADPQLRVGRVGIDLVDDAALEGVPRHARVEAADAPGVVLDDGTEGQNVALRVGGVGVLGRHLPMFVILWFGIVGSINSHRATAMRRSILVS